MKKLLVYALLVTLAAAPAFAAAPDKVTLPAKNGNVTFDHKAHTGRADCKACHEGEPGKMKLGKDSAHKLCKGCHESKAAGPTKCGDCHKK